MSKTKVQISMWWAISLHHCHCAGVLPDYVWNGDLALKLGIPWQQGGKHRSAVPCNVKTRTMDAVVNLFGIISSFILNGPAWSMGAHIRTCGLLCVFWLAGESRAGHASQGWAHFHHHCLVMSSLAGSASTSTAQPQSRAWPIKCQMPWLRRSYWHFFYNALKISKIQPCQACKLCLRRMELGTHLPATALFSLILPCFLGNFCWEWLLWAF